LLILHKTTPLNRHWIFNITYLQHYYFFLLALQTSDVQYQDTSIIQQHASIIFADTAIKAIVLRRHAKVRPSGFEEKISMPNTMVLR